jgi:hypothetical protein
VAVALARAGDGRADALFAEARAAADALPDDQREFRWADLAGALGRAGRLAAALEVLRGIETETRREAGLVKVASALIDACDLDRGREIIAMIPDLGRRAYLFRRALVLLLRAGDSRAETVFHSALGAARSLAHRGPGELRELALALAREKSPRAGAVLNEVRQQAALAREGDTGGSMEWDSTLAAVAAVLVAAGQLRPAEGVAPMIKDGHERWQSLCGLAEALARDRNKRADVLFGELRRAAGDRHGGTDHGRAMLAEALARAGRHAAAEKLARAVSSSELRAGVLCELAAAPDRSKRSRTAAIRKARATAGTIQEPLVRAMVLARLVTALVRCERLTDAEEVARQIDEGWYRGRALGEVGAALARSGTGEAGVVFRKAWQAVRSLPDAKERSEAFCQLGNALVLAGDAEADAAYREAEKAADAIPYRGQQHFRPWEPALHELACSLAWAGRHGEALRLARVLQVDVWRADVLCRVAEEMVRRNAPGADALFEEAEQTASATQDFKERRAALLDVAAAYARAGRFGRALAVAGLLPLHDFLAALVGWAPSFDRVCPGLAVEVLQQVTEVAGWTSPKWQRVHVLLTASEAEGEGG